MSHTPLISMLLFALAAVLGAVGQFLYKAGADAASGGLTGYVTSPRLLGGVVCYAAVMVLFVAAFRQGGSLAVLYPIYASTFIWAAIIARFAYGVPILPVHVAGWALLIVGMGCMGWTPPQSDGDRPYPPTEAFGSVSSPAGVLQMSEPPPSDRRPLKTRSWPIFQSLAARLAQGGVSPNAISIASVFFAAIGAVGLVATEAVEDPSWQRIAWFVAATGVQMRLIANLLDGMVAVEGGRAAPTGPLYNEVPDRLSDPVLLIAAGYAASGVPVAGWAAAAMALLVAYVRAIGASVGAGQLFLGPMAKQQRMALLTGVCLAGIALPEPWMHVGRWGLMELALWAIVAGGVVTVIRRLRAAARHLRRVAEAAS